MHTEQLGGGTLERKAGRKWDSGTGSSQEVEKKPREQSGGGAVERKLGRIGAVAHKAVGR